MIFKPFEAWAMFYRQLGVDPASVRVADIAAEAKAQDDGNGCPLWVADQKNPAECAYCPDRWEAHSERARTFGSPPPSFQGPIPAQVTE